MTLLDYSNGCEEAPLTRRKGEGHSREQFMSALDRANEIRLARAAIKRAINAGTLSVADALAKDCVREMKVYALLMAQRRVGRSKTLMLLKPLGIGEHRHVSSLSPRQRDALVSMLRQSSQVRERKVA